MQYFNTIFNFFYSFLSPYKIYDNEIQSFNVTVLPLLFIIINFYFLTAYYMFIAYVLVYVSVDECVHVCMSVRVCV